jgi:hypothetical protein
MPSPIDGHPLTPARQAALELLSELEILLTGPVPDLALSPMPAAADWARSGAMALTGRAEGPPRLSPGSPASVVRGALEVFNHFIEHPVTVGSQVLGEHAALNGLTRQAPMSVGGRFRALRSLDGWIGLSLARESDVDLLPALTRSSVRGDPWTAVAAWLATQKSSVAEGRLRLLGLPASIIGDSVPKSTRSGVLVTSGRRRAQRASPPLVVDLTSLWAGPLCANLLGLAGARVIKVESHDRPDGGRSGSARFFNLLHGHHQSVALDFPRDADKLRGLLRRADVVLEASRPRALEQLGVVAGELVDEGVTWVSVSAYGRRGTDGMRVGFGDDVAAGAGLTVKHGVTPYPVGDAISDPLTGVYAAACAAVALRSERSCLLDVSMHDVSCIAAAITDSESNCSVDRVGDRWIVRTGAEVLPVAEPQARAPTGVAPLLGEHTDEVLTEFGL